MARIFLLALVFLIAGTGTAQNCKRDLKQAKDWSRKGFLQKASSLLEPQFDCLKKDRKRLLLSSQIHFEANRLEQAEKGYLILLQKKFKPKECLRGLAEIRHQQLRFREAIAYYKELFALLKKNDPERVRILSKINTCVTGIQESRSEPMAWVEALSSTVNTDQDEYAPYPSPTHPGRYYYSAVREDCQGGRRNEEGAPDASKGRLRADLYVYDVDPARSKSIRDLSHPLSSNYEERVTAVCAEGSVLVFYQTWDGDKGKFRSDTFSEKRYRFEYPEFKSPLNPELGDQEFFLFQDSLLIFSSDRIGGFGGKDLYLSILRHGQWTDPVNLGTPVNSSFDETDPWLARDGRTLYFTSNRPGSLGGYDVFKTSFGAEQKAWRNPENLGLPINSPGHDRYFRLNPDGISAIFCSDRKLNNAGLRDLYLTIFKVELPEQSRQPAGSILSQLADNPFAMVSNRLVPDQTTQTVNPNLPKEKKRIILKDLPFGGTDFQKDPRYKKMLSALIPDLVETAPAGLWIIAHTHEELPPAGNLYLGLKTGRMLADDLISEGLEPERIRYLSVQEPDVTTRIQNQKNKGAPTSWIEIRLTETVESPFFIEYIPIQGAGGSAKKNEDYFAKRKGLSYSIYLGEASGISPHGLLQKSDAIRVAIPAKNNEQAFYYYGLYPDFKSALESASSFQDQALLRITAFLDGQKIEKQQIVQYARQYPDLLYLLDHYLKHGE